jgi:hypothetical protein
MFRDCLHFVMKHNRPHQGSDMEMNFQGGRGGGTKGE